MIGESGARSGVCGEGAVYVGVLHQHELGRGGEAVGDEGTCVLEQPVRTRRTHEHMYARFPQTT